VTTERAAPLGAPVGAVADPSELLPSRVDSPRLVLRPHLQWRVAGPALLVVALLVLVAGRVRAVPFALVFAVAGVAFLSAWRDRIEVGATSIRRRTWRRETTVDISDVDTLRLRRVAFPLLRWLPRGYKVGRFWSIPLTVRLLSGEDPRLEIRCGWWSNWQELTRFVISAYPDVDLDGRTRGRLERYVGVRLPAASQR
jgi:hypothetical protein